MTFTSETRVQTRKNIIDAFWEIYEAKGKNAITVKEIIRKAGYNRSTFYDYFVDIVDLMDAIEQSLIPTIDSLPPIDLASHAVGLPVDEFLSIFKINQKYYLMLLGENGDPSFGTKLKKSIKQTIVSSMAFTEPLAQKHSEYAIEYVLSGMIGILVYWLANPQKIAESEVISLIREVMPSIDAK